MLEWQSESSLFTVRVRGKQWYWIYKFELKSITDVLSAPKNIGHNRWFISVFNDLKSADDYFHITQLRAQGNWAFNYWKSLIERHMKDPNFFANTPQELLIMDHNKTAKTRIFAKTLKRIEAERNASKSKHQVLNLVTKDRNLFVNDISESITKDIEAYKKMKYTSFGVSYENHTPKGRLFTPKSPCGFFPKKNFYKPNLINSLSQELKDFLKNDPAFVFNNPEVADVTRWAKQTDGLQKPIRLIKTPLKYTNFNESNVELNNNFKLFRLRFLESSDEPQVKPMPHTTYLTFKQKRYQRRDKFSGFNTLFDNNKLNKFREYPVNIFISEQTTKVTEPALIVLKTFLNNTRTQTRLNISSLNELFKKYLLIQSENLANDLNTLENLRKDGKEPKPAPKFNPYLVQNKLVVDNLSSVKSNYRMFTKNKNSSEDISNVLGRRLLRTKRTLVLPTHVNITIITNSYDVIHSWFIPGLGLKLDCIPGRSTHHLLHIDNVGFYYGQCAEICGRYHHHMPIRVCALPFEHFLVWWHTFGLPKMLNHSSKFKLDSGYSSKKYVW